MFVLSDYHNMILIKYFFCRSILVTTGIFVFVGTVCDVLFFDNPGHHSIGTLSILSCFSLIRNTRIVFHTKSVQCSKGISIEQRFTYLHGVRTLFIIWIIMAHCCSLMPASITMPFSFIARYPHDMIQMFQKNRTFGNFLNNGTLAVEAFFVIRYLFGQRYSPYLSGSRSLFNSIFALVECY